MSKAQGYGKSDVPLHEVIYQAQRKNHARAARERVACTSRGQTSPAAGAIGGALHRYCGQPWYRLSVWEKNASRMGWGDPCPPHARTGSLCTTSLPPRERKNPYSATLYSYHAGKRAAGRAVVRCGMWT